MLGGALGGFAGGAVGARVASRNAVAVVGAIGALLALWGVYSFYVFYPERLWFPIGLFVVSPYSLPWDVLQLLDFGTRGQVADRVGRAREHGLIGNAGLDTPSRGRYS